jgi:hypothetical protein
VSVCQTGRLTCIMPTVVVLPRLREWHKESAKKKVEAAGPGQYSVYR